MKRSGVVLVAVLVALLVVSLISATIVRGLVVQHRQARIEQQRTQALWLAESAIDRAIAQLQADADYKGETWNVSQVADGIEASGQATIRIQPVAGSTAQREIHVEARWPNNLIDGTLFEQTVAVAVRDRTEDP